MPIIIYIYFIVNHFGRSGRCGKITHGYSNGTRLTTHNNRVSKAYARVVQANVTFLVDIWQLRHAFVFSTDDLFIEI